MPVIFTNLWMLAGLAALSIPVVIHLLLRRKKKRARFSTLQFFMRQDEQAAQRRKLQNWLLLALRLCIFTLLVLAFARPYWNAPGATGAGNGQRQVVVLLDRSLSMQANDLDGAKWLRAKEAAERILNELAPGDRAALVGCGIRAEILSEWAPAAAVRKALVEVAPTFGAAPLTEGLQQAGRLLSVADPAAPTAIYIIGDLQRHSCQELSHYPLPRETELRIVPVGDLATPNLAITDLQLRATADTGPHVVITSYSDEDSPDLQLEFTVDGQRISSATFPLAAGSSTNLDLALPFLGPGWHDVAVRLTDRDALAHDNQRVDTLFVPAPASTLIVEPRTNVRPYDQESFFVSTALDPGSGSTNGVQSPFAAERVSADELLQRLNPEGQLSSARWIVIPGLQQPPPGLGAKLQGFVQSGGGLLLFLGDDVSAVRYQAEFRSLLPAALGTIQENATGAGAWRIGFYDTNAPLFAPFTQPNSGNLRLARFGKRFSFDSSDPGQVVARFDDHVPFLITRDLGRGRVVLVNTSADTAWNDWPKHKSFVPWVHGAGHYLARTESPQEIQARNRLATGTSEDVDLGEAAAKATFQLVGADGQPVTFTADDQGTLRDVTLAQPGVYSLRQASGEEIRRLAANVPVVESDLAALAASDVQQQIARTAAPRQASLAAGLFAAGSNQREIWRVLLFTVLLLLGVEMLIANRTLA